MSIPQGTSRILTVSSSNTSLQLLSAGQVAFHTDNTEVWKDSGLPRMTGHLNGVHQPAGPLDPHMSIPLDSASVRHRGALALCLLTLPLFCWPPIDLPRSSLALTTGPTLSWKEHRKTTPSASIILGRSTVCEVEFWKAVYAVGSPLRSLAEVLNLAAETIKKEFLFHFSFLCWCPG